MQDVTDCSFKANFLKKPTNLFFNKLITSTRAKQIEPNYEKNSNFMHQSGATRKWSSNFFTLKKGKPFQTHKQAESWEKLLGENSKGRQFLSREKRQRRRRRRQCSSDVCPLHFAARKDSARKVLSTCLWTNSKLLQTLRGAFFWT